MASSSHLHGDELYFTGPILSLKLILCPLRVPRTLWTSTTFTCWRGRNNIPQGEYGLGGQWEQRTKKRRSRTVSRKEKEINLLAKPCIPAPINSHCCSPQHLSIRTPALPPTGTSVEEAEREGWQARREWRQAKQRRRENTFGGLFFTQDSQHSSENLILPSCSCLLTRTNLILKQHAEPTGEKHFAMALRSHLEWRAQLNSFGSCRRNTSSWGTGPVAWESSSQEGTGDSLAPVNHTIQMALLSSLTNPTPCICGGWRWQERRAICCVEHLPLAWLAAWQLAPWFLEKNGLLPHITKSWKLLFYQEHARFSYQHVNLLWFYALLWQFGKQADKNQVLFKGKVNTLMCNLACQRTLETCCFCLPSAWAYSD